MANVNLADQPIRDLFDDLSGVDLVMGMLNTAAGEKLAAFNAHGRFALFDKKWPDGDAETMIEHVPAGRADPARTEQGEPLAHLHVYAPWTGVRTVRLEPAPVVAKKIGADVRITLLSGDKPVCYFFATASDPAFQAVLAKRQWRVGGTYPLASGPAR